MSDEVIHKWANDPVRKVKLMKMSKGHQWEISMGGGEISFADILAEIRIVNDALQKEYGTV
jgi:hypothetical protein